MDADAVLQVVAPRANVLVSIFEHHSALAVLVALVEIARVVASVFEREFTLALENTLFQVAFVGLLLLGEVVYAVSVEKPISEVALVVAAVGPVVATAPMHLALVELAAEPDLAEFPGLLAEAILKVVDPLALGSAPLLVDKAAVAVGHVVLPVALVDVSVGLGHAALALHFVVHKLANVARAIFPGEHANTIASKFTV